MDRAYHQLRVWEHRLQLRKLSRTHLMPADEDGLRVSLDGTQSNGQRGRPKYRATVDQLTKMKHRTS